MTLTYARLNLLDNGAVLAYWLAHVDHGKSFLKIQPRVDFVKWLAKFSPLFLFLGALSAVISTYFLIIEDVKFRTTELETAIEETRLAKEVESRNIALLIAQFNSINFQKTFVPTKAPDICPAPVAAMNMCPPNTKTAEELALSKSENSNTIARPPSQASSAANITADEQPPEAPTLFLAKLGIGFSFITILIGLLNAYMIGIKEKRENKIRELTAKSLQLSICKQSLEIEALKKNASTVENKITRTDET